MSAALVALFAPYCQGTTRRDALEQALDLLGQGALKGQRQLRPSGVRTFALRWRPGVAPLEPSEVALQVESGSPDVPVVDYSFSLPTYQLVLWLMDWAQSGGAEAQADLPASFWQWLLLGLDPAAVRA